MGEGIDELPFVVVNETVRAVPYDQAVLWDARTERVAALSGAARLEAGAPYVLLLDRLYRNVVATGKRDQPQALGPCGGPSPFAAIPSPS